MSEAKSTITEAARIRQIAMEHWAEQLYAALCNALAGKPFWRLEGMNLVYKVDSGILPTPRTPPHQQQQNDEAA